MASGLFAGIVDALPRTISPEGLAMLLPGNILKPIHALEEAERFAAWLRSMGVPVEREFTASAAVFSDGLADHLATPRAAATRYMLCAGAAWRELRDTRREMGLAPSRPLRVLLEASASGRIRLEGAQEILSAAYLESLLVPHTDADRRRELKLLARVVYQWSGAVEKNRRKDHAERMLGMVGSNRLVASAQAFISQIPFAPHFRRLGELRDGNRHADLRPAAGRKSACLKPILFDESGRGNYMTLPSRVPRAGSEITAGGMSVEDITQMKRENMPGCELFEMPHHGEHNCVEAFAIFEENTETEESGSIGACMVGRLLDLGDAPGTMATLRVNLQSAMALHRNDERDRMNVEAAGCCLAAACIRSDCEMLVEDSLEQGGKLHLILTIGHQGEVEELLESVGKEAAEAAIAGRKGVELDYTFIRTERAARP